MFEESFDLDNLNREWMQSIDIFIFGDSTDERVLHLPKKLFPVFKGVAYKFSYDVTGESCIISRVSSVKSVVEELYSGDITVGLSPILERIGVLGKRVLVDITGMKHPAFFYLFKLLIEEHKPGFLFAGYSEPKRYVPHGSTEVEERFQLFEGYLGVHALPGFTRLPNTEMSKLLVAFLGFEGTRLQHVYDDQQPGDGNIVAVVGFPAFRPGWQNLTIAANEPALYSTRSYRFLRSATAFSPFDAYRVLCDLRLDRPKQHLVVAPLGTRPHALGAALYAIKNSDAYLLYDFPIEVVEHRTERVGKCHIYHLSSFL